MNGSVNGINLHRSNNIEPGLFKAKAHSTRTGEKVDRNRARPFISFCEAS